MADASTSDHDLPTPRLDVDKAIKDPGGYLKPFLHPNDRAAHISKFERSDPCVVFDDTADSVTPDEFGVMPDMLRQAAVTLSASAFMNQWRKVIFLPWLSYDALMNKPKFHLEMATLEHTIDEADRLLHQGGHDLVVFPAVTKPVAGARASQSSLLHCVLVLRTKNACFFVDDNGDYDKASNYSVWNTEILGPVRRLGQVEAKAGAKAKFEAGFSTALDELMESAGFLERRLCIAYVIKAAALIVQMEEDEVLKMIAGPNGDKMFFYNEVHEKIFNALWSEMFSSVRSAS